MAGIGFELKKLFVGRGAIRKVRAYAYASIVCSGTMLLAVALLLCIQQISRLAGAPEHTRETLVVMIIYAMLASMLLSSSLQTFLSRYVADMLYREMPERVLPSLLGASLTLMVPGGVLYALLLSRAPMLPIADRVLNWILFMELIPTWLQMAYITAAKDYRRILIVFAQGVGTSLLLGAGLCFGGVNVQTAMLLALVMGYGVMLTGFTSVLLRYFPAGSGSPFAFLESLDHISDLILTGFLVMAGAFSHMMLMWFSPLGESVAGPFRQASTYDTAAFYAFLVTIPANVSFIVSVEVNFYEKYQLYFGAITGGGTLAEITTARKNMTVTLRQEVFKLTQIQVFFMIAHIVLLRYLLVRIGFTTSMVSMFQVMSVGYSAYAIGNCVMLLQLYFNDRMGALMSAAAFFIATVLATLFTMNGSPLYYGLGVACGGAAMYIVGVPRLFRYVKHIDYHVFCEQPILSAQKIGFWTRLAAKLDAGMRVEDHSSNKEAKA